MQSRTPLWAEDAGWGTPISRPERDPVPEACSSNGMPLQGPFPGFKDVDIRTHGPMILTENRHKYLTTSDLTVTDFFLNFTVN
jgi:hypothetical protein